MKQKVLIAISQKINALFWSDAFEKAGYSALIFTEETNGWQQFIQNHTPDILFTEVTFADNMGFELARLARLVHPSLRCIICMPTARNHRSEAFRVDVSGYLPEDIEDVDEVLYCLNQISQGYRYISPVFRSTSDFPSNQQKQLIAGLSPRRKQILKLLTEGCTARQIAQQLEIAEATVRHHKEQIAELVGLPGVYQLKIFAGAVAHLLK